MTEHTLENGSTLTMRDDGGALISTEHDVVELSAADVAAIRGFGLDTAKLLEWLGDQSYRAPTSMESGAYLDVAQHVRGMVSTLGKSNGWEDAALRAMSPLCEVSEPAPRVSELPEGARWDGDAVVLADGRRVERGPPSMPKHYRVFSAGFNDGRIGEGFSQLCWVDLAMAGAAVIARTSSPGANRGEGSGTPEPGRRPHPSDSLLGVEESGGVFEAALRETLREMADDDCDYWVNGDMPCHETDAAVGEWCHSCRAGRVLASEPTKPILGGGAGERSLVRRLVAKPLPGGHTDALDAITEGAFSSEQIDQEPEDRSELPPGYWVEGTGDKHLEIGILCDRGGPIRGVNTDVDGVEGARRYAVEACWAHRDNVVAAQLERLRARPSGHVEPKAVDEVLGADGPRPGLFTVERLRQEYEFGQSAAFRQMASYATGALAVLDEEDDGQ